MSRQSPGNSEQVGAPVRTMMRGGPEPAERGRSLSMAVPNQYYVSECDAAAGTSTNPQYSPGQEDIPQLQRLYRELLIHNMRLWECVNIIRCNAPRLNATDVLRRMYAMSDEEFMRKYPYYDSFRETGHGALDSRDLAGGLHHERKYVLHLLEHTNGLMRENARLKHCLHLLTVCPDRTADEVVSHCFSLNDENFVKRYPEADRDSRLTVSLNRLKEEEGTRHRSSSLPGHLANIAFRRRDSSIEKAGPSRSNNNDVLLARAPVRSCSGSPRAHDPVCEDDGRFCGGHLDRIRPLSEVIFPSRRLSGSPEPKPKVREGRDWRSVRYDQPVGRSHVPYMVSHYPYNWATITDSYFQTTAENGKDNEQSGTEFQPEDNEESGVVYRKCRNTTRLGRRWNQASGGGPDRPVAQKTRGPRITFSRSPAATRSSSVPKTRPGSNVSREDTPSDTERRRAMRRTTPKPSALSGLRKDSLGKRPTATERGNTTGKIVGKRSSVVSTSPRKRLQTHSFHDRKPLSGTKQVGKNVTFEQNNDHVSHRNTKKSVGVDRAPSADRTPRYFSEEQDLCQRLRPMYYKRPVHRNLEPQLGCDSECDDDFYSPRRQVWRQSPECPLRHPDDPFWTAEKRTSTPLFGRRCRSHSEELYLNGRQYVLDPDQSRKELLDFRNSLCQSPCSSFAVRPLAFHSPDSLETSPVDRRHNLSPHGRLRSPSDPAERRYPGLNTDSGDRGTETYTRHPGTSPRLHRKSSDTSRDAESTRTSQMNRHLLSSDKLHRIPTHRPLSSSSAGDTKKAKTVGRARNKGTPPYQLNENTNRDTDSTPKTSDHSSEESGHFGFPHSLSFREMEENVIDQLLKEKRQLYEKYQDNGHLDERRWHDSHPDEIYRDTCYPHDKYPERSDLQNEKVRWELPERYGVRSDLPDKHHDSFYLSDEYHNSDLHKNAGPGRKSRSEPSPRTHRSLDLEVGSGGRRGRHHHPLPLPHHPYPAYPLQEPAGARPHHRSEENLVEGVEQEEGEEEDQYVSTIQKLRAETLRLRDKTEQYRQERQWRAQHMPVQTPLVKAYSNLGRPAGLDTTSTNSRRGGPKQRDKNSNASDPQVANPSSTPPRLTAFTNNSTSNSRGDSVGDRELRVSPPPSRPHHEERAVTRLKEKADDVSWNSILQAPSTILGEVAFQLENRIIREVFGGVSSWSSSEKKAEKEDGDDESVSTDDTEKRHRFYGFTVQNLTQKIRGDCRDPVTGKRDSAREARLLRRYQDVIAFLRHNFGYHVHKHGKLSQQLIQQHGIFILTPDAVTIARLGLHDFRSLRNHVIRLADPDKCPDLLVLVDCLRALGQKQNQPILCFR